MKKETIILSICSRTDPILSWSKIHGQYIILIPLIFILSCRYSFISEETIIEDVYTLISEHKKEVDRIIAITQEIESISSSDEVQISAHRTKNHVIWIQEKVKLMDNSGRKGWFFMPVDSALKTELYNLSESIDFREIHKSENTIEIKLYEYINPIFDVSDSFRIVYTNKGEDVFKGYQNYIYLMDGYWIRFLRD